MLPPDVLFRICALRKEGRSCREIADILNAAEVSYRAGRKWNDDAVWYVLHRHTERAATRRGAKPFGSIPEERSIIEFILKERAQRKTYKVIADMLNERGQMTRSRRRWTVSRVQAVARSTPAAVS